jgi:hypothetical protein
MMNYVSFSDESYSQQGFKSIAAFSLKADNLEQVNLRLKKIFEESKVEEFKWQKLKDAKYRFCAQKLVDIVWEFIETYDARIDVITWDINDSRHRIKHRDDSANYERMFYHLHSSALKRRPKLSTWKIYPDEGVGVNWNVVAQCLHANGQKREQINLPLFTTTFFDDVHYKIVDFKEIESHEEPCCQIADLFAGMGIFSRTHYDLYDLYEKSNDFTKPVLPLFPQEEPEITKAEKERLPILQYFNQGCKERKLGVSLKSKRCLHTPDPKNPINFWNYTPQHDRDKAPTKSKP